jgi:hypothetical protein
MKLVTCVLLLALLAAAPASAQQCIGNPSFQDGPYQAGLSAAFTEGARGVGGTFAGGGETLFAGAGLSVVNFTDLDVRSAAVSGFAGAEVATDTRNRVLLCPLVQLTFVAGPDIGAVDVSTASLQAGGSVGVIAYDSNGVMAVPFFGLALLYQHVTAEIGGTEDSVSDTGGVADLGLGLIFNRNVGITPIVSIPFSAGTSDVAFTIRFSFNFGR